MEPLREETGRAKFDLTLFLAEEGDGLRGSFEYKTDLFERATIERMAGHFQALLEGIVAHPDCRLSELPLLTAAERRQILVEWNDTNVDYPRDACIHHLFEAQVERTPEVVVGLLGILKAGGAYVPLDPDYPKERLAFMARDTAVGVVLTQSRLKTRLPAGISDVVCVDSGGDRLSAESEANLADGAGAGNLVYVTYTSGSTGIPKRVEILHRGVVRLVADVVLKTGADATVTPGDRKAGERATKRCRRRPKNENRDE